MLPTPTKFSYCYFLWVIPIMFSCPLGFQCFAIGLSYPILDRIKSELHCGRFAALRNSSIWISVLFKYLEQKFNKFCWVCIKIIVRYCWFSRKCRLTIQNITCFLWREIKVNSQDIQDLFTKTQSKLTIILLLKMKKYYMTFSYYTVYSRKLGIYKLLGM